MKFLARLLGLATGTGVSTSSTEQPPRRFEMGGISFAVPGGWSYEQVNGGTLLMAPVAEKNWQANIFVEPRTDGENRPLERAVADLVPSLIERKNGFKELHRFIEHLPCGITYAVLEYSHYSQGAPLQDCEIIVSLSGPGRIFVLCSTEATLYDKYQPTFKAFLASMVQSKIDYAVKLLTNSSVVGSSGKASEAMLAAFPNDSPEALEEELKRARALVAGAVEIAERVRSNHLASVQAEKLLMEAFPNFSAELCRTALAYGYFATR